MAETNGQVDRPTIGLLGDVMLGRLVAQRLEDTEPAELWAEEVREVCAACDAMVVNLECCVSGRGEPTELIPAKPFFFRSPPAGIGALEAIGTTVAGMANNHALDFGPVALLDTLDHLAGAGVAAVGAGPDASRARAGVVVTAGPARLGVLAVSDHPRQYAAGDSSPGIAFADLDRGLPEWALAELSRMREEAELVLAFPHWGPNMTVRPAAWQRERARELLDAGADAVAGHSAHVFHGIARRGDAPLLHDLGGALDDYAVDAELRNDLGLLALWRPGGEPGLELVGLKLEFCRTELARDGDAEWISARLERACAELGTAVSRRGEARFAVVPE